MKEEKERRGKEKTIKVKSKRKSSSVNDEAEGEGKSSSVLEDDWKRGGKLRRKGGGEREMGSDRMTFSSSKTKVKANGKVTMKRVSISESGSGL